MGGTGPGAEVGVLLGYLNAQRRHVRAILEGLDDAALRRPVLPSGWTCLGLVQHLALDVERFWFRCVVAGEPAAIKSLDGIGNAWHVPDAVSAEEVFATYREECRLADEIIAATPLATVPAWWPADQFGDWRLDDLREVILHVITETACHAGHLDAVRELIDGTQRLVLTG